MKFLFLKLITTTLFLLSFGEAMAKPGDLTCTTPPFGKNYLNTKTFTVTYDLTSNKMWARVDDWTNTEVSGVATKETHPDGTLLLMPFSASGRGLLHLELLVRRSVPDTIQTEPARLFIDVPLTREEEAADGRSKVRMIYSCRGI